MNREIKSLAVVLASGADILLNLIAVSCAYFLASEVSAAVILPTDVGCTAFVAVTLVSLSAVYQLLGVYSPIPRTGEYGVFSRVISAELLSVMLLLTAEAFLLDGRRFDFAALWTVLFFILGTLLLLLEKLIVVTLVRISRRSDGRLHGVIVVGDNNESAALFVREILARPSLGVRIVGTVGVDATEQGIALLGGLDRFDDIIRSRKPEAVIFALCRYDERWLIDAVDLVDNACARVYFLPVIHGYFKSVSQVTTLGTLPLVNARSTPLDDRRAAFIKRAFDVLVSLVLVLLTLPLMLAAAIGVKLTSRGSVLFKQRRVGRLGKQFTMLKFRSMRESSISDTAWSTGVDPRKTRFGNLLRKTSIDELPQLFNVLRGDMSLVGPRPEIPYFVDRFKRKIPLYMVKHYVKPGITGLAQIKGLRGDTSIEDRITEDIRYIENWSFALDLYILFKTPLAAFNKREVYLGGGDDEEA